MLPADGRLRSARRRPDGSRDWAGSKWRMENALPWRDGGAKMFLELILKGVPLADISTGAFFCRTLGRSSYK